MAIGFLDKSATLNAVNTGAPITPANGQNPYVKIGEQLTNNFTNGFVRAVSANTNSSQWLENEVAKVISLNESNLAEEAVNKFKEWNLKALNGDEDSDISNPNTQVINSLNVFNESKDKLEAAKQVRGLSLLQLNSAEGSSVLYENASKEILSHITKDLPYAVKKKTYDRINESRLSTLSSLGRNEAIERRNASINNLKDVTAKQQKIINEEIAQQIVALNNSHDNSLKNIDSLAYMAYEERKFISDWIKKGFDNSSGQASEAFKTYIENNKESMAEKIKSLTTKGDKEFNDIKASVKLSLDEQYTSEIREIGIHFGDLSSDVKLSAIKLKCYQMGLDPSKLSEYLKDDKFKDILNFTGDEFDKSNRYALVETLLAKSSDGKYLSMANKVMENAKEWGLNDTAKNKLIQEEINTKEATLSAKDKTEKDFHSATISSMLVALDDNDAYKFTSRNFIEIGNTLASQGKFELAKLYFDGAEKQQSKIDTWKTFESKSKAAKASSFMLNTIDKIQYIKPIDDQGNIEITIPKSGGKEGESIKVVMNRGQALRKVSEVAYANGAIKETRYKELVKMANDYSMTSGYIPTIFNVLKIGEGKSGKNIDYDKTTSENVYGFDILQISAVDKKVGVTPNYANILTESYGDEPLDIADANNMIKLLSLHAMTFSDKFKKEHGRVPTKKELEVELTKQRDKLLYADHKYTRGETVDLMSSVFNSYNEGIIGSGYPEKINEFGRVLRSYFE